jgi:type I restriction enzyme, S subunit
MSDDLPQGWAEMPLASVVYFQEGPGLRKWQFGESGIPFLNIRTFENGRINRSQCQFVKMEEFQGKYEHFLLNEGDLVVSSSGTLGKVATIRAEDLPMMLNTSTIRFRARYREALAQDFLRFYVQSHHFFRQIDSAKTGSAILNYGPSHLKQMSIMLAPPSEQRRIVAKLEKLLGRVNACQQRLAKITVLLKRFRQSVLAAACSGRLTADWREKNPANEVAEEGELPLGWKPVCVGDVIESLKYGTAQKCSYEKRGVPVLRIPNVVNGVIDHADLKYATLPPKELRQLRLAPGDILLIRSNGSVSLVGKSALVRKSEVDFAYAGYLIRLRPNHALVEPEFLNLALSSYGIRLQIELEARSTSGVNNINSEEVRALRFSLSPVAEQQEIVRGVEALFALADQLEARYAKAAAHVEKLTQAILAKAFRGELIAQDPNDEPASVLLERIKAERDENESQKRKRNRAPLGAFEKTGVTKP